MKNNHIKLQPQINITKSKRLQLNTDKLGDSWYISIQSVQLTLLILIGCLLLSSCKEEPSSQTQSVHPTNQKSITEEKIENDKKVILFYGNSLTAGYGLDDNESFPSLIEDKIDSIGLNYKVVNAGLSGETTSGGLKRINWVMKQKVDIFFLELGANDMLRGLPLNQTRKNLNEIIAFVKTKNPDVVIGLCEMMAPPNMGENYVNEFNKIYKELSNSNNVKLIPFFLEGVAGNEELLLKDGKHPNAAGQKIVAKNIWNSLEPML